MIIALIIIGALLLLFVLSHFFVTYIIFSKFFKRKNNDIIKEFAYKNLDEEQTDYLNAAIKELQTHDHQEVSVTSYDNKKLVGDYYPSTSDKLIIFFHGFQADTYMSFGVQAEHFLKNNYHIILIDERSHHRSGGKYIGYGYFEHHDVLSWIEYASKLDGINEISCYGISMGGTSIAIASEHIKNSKVKHLIVEDAYANLEKLADDIAETQHIPFWIFKSVLALYIRFVAKIKKGVDTSEALKHNKIHTIFVRSEKDGIVSLKFFNDNYNNCASKKDKIFIPNAKHAWGVLVGKENFLNELDKKLGE